MTITKRNTKGSSLTYAEMDENIRDLYEDTTLDRVVGNGATTTTPVNLTRIIFPAYQDDYAFIDTTVNGTSTSLDFVVGDDDGDSFRWRFNHYADGAGTPVNYMTLRADQTNDDRNTGVLDVTGTINTDGLVLGQNGTVSFEGSTSGDNDTILTVVDPTADRTISLPNASGTVALDGVNQTAYRTGEVIEIITGYADGSTISGQATTAGAARNFALEDVTAAQELTISYAKINGTLVTYLPPVGTKTLEIEYGIFVGYAADSTSVMHHKLSVGGTYVTNTRMTHRDDSAMNKYVVLKSILTVDGSGDVAAGNVDSWSSAIALQLDGREYGGSSEAKLHLTHYYDGSATAGDQVVVPPSVKITAIG
tara:strand:- start:5471 stop:6565 length:1095 start_codon:yes stop_codon:yes gene_type:complete